MSDHSGVRLFPKRSFVRYPADTRPWQPTSLFAANVSRNLGCLRTEASMIASSYTYSMCNELLFEVSEPCATCFR